MATKTQWMWEYEFIMLYLGVTFWCVALIHYTTLDRIMLLLQAAVMIISGYSVTRDRRTVFVMTMVERGLEFAIAIGQASMLALFLWLLWSSTTMYVKDVSNSKIFYILMMGCQVMFCMFFKHWYTRKVSREPLCLTNVVSQV